jgi:N-acetyl-alpha-D-glucosaminyl L-malate synthase BshA
MRIAISCYPSFGGSGIVATELAMGLAAVGDEVHVISYALPPRLVSLGPNLVYHEVVVPRYPLFEYPPYSLALATKMVEVARNHQVDLVHVHYAVPNAVSAVLARQILAPQPLRVVTTLHGTDITLVGTDPSYLETTRYGIVQSDAVTAVSAALRQQTFDQLGTTLPIDVIPNFIEPERFDAVANRPGARPGERILIHISNFRAVKRVQDVVEVFRRVHHQVQARLILVGDGPERARVEADCRQHGLCDAITFVGNLPLVEEILVGADLFLLPSESESFGLAALEALSCRVPVIATRVGGLPEVVVDGENGYLLPVGDVAGMADAAIGLLRDHDRHQQFADHARRWSVEQFSAAAVIGRYRDLYRRVLAGR